MRLSSNLILLVTTAIPGINGSSFVSRALITANLAKQKVTEKRQLSDMNIDMEDPEVLCSLLSLFSLMNPDPDATMTMECNEDFTEMEVSNFTAIEICDGKNEFCQKDTSMSTILPLVDLSEEMSNATISVCTTYTKVPSDEFMELVDKELCVNGKGKVDAAMMFDGMGDDSSEDQDTSASYDTDTDSEMMESCTANIGDEICMCSVCENGEVKLSCPTLGFNTEDGCTSIMGDDGNHYVMRFTKVEPTDSATPSTDPSSTPSGSPSLTPSTLPSSIPSRDPSPAPSESPTSAPSMALSNKPTTAVEPTDSAGFTKVELTDSAASVGLTVICLFLTLTLAAVLV